MGGVYELSAGLPIMIGSRFDQPRSDIGGTGIARLFGRLVRVTPTILPPPASIRSIASRTAGVRVLPLSTISNTWTEAAASSEASANPSIGGPSIITVS